MAKSGGTTGGWEEYDHETFIKFRTRYHVTTFIIIIFIFKLSINLFFLTASLTSHSHIRIHGSSLQNRPEFIEELARIMLSHNATEIAAHNDWYSEFERLLSAKREAIARWRFERKRREAEARGERLAGGASGGAASTDEGDDANEDASEDEMHQLEREERLARLAAWKVLNESDSCHIYIYTFGKFKAFSKSGYFILI